MNYEHFNPETQAEFPKSFTKNRSIRCSIVSAMGHRREVMCVFPKKKLNKHLDSCSVIAINYLKK